MLEDQPVHAANNQAIEDTQMPKPGDRYVPVRRGDESHALSIIVHSVGTNHVRFTYYPKVRRKDGNRLHKMRLDEFFLKFRPQ